MTSHQEPEGNKEHERARDVLLRELTAFYADQAHLIDSGSHREWAETFTPDGEFHSPTYPDPAVGREALSHISEAFADTAKEANEVHRHVVTNLAVVASGRHTARTRAYLLVTASGGESARILRVVTVRDDLVYSDARWQVRHRQVTPDVRP